MTHRRGWRSTGVICLFVMLAMPQLVRAQAVPVSEEPRVDTPTTKARFLPALAANAVAAAPHRDGASRSGNGGFEQPDVEPTATPPVTAPTDAATSTPTCTPHSAPPPFCDPGESYVCSDQQCRLGCVCVPDTPTPSPTRTPTTTCPPVFPPQNCTAQENVTCQEYRCGFDCGCACPGDCNRDDRISLAELVAAVRIALGHAPATDCLAAICDCYPGTACAEGVRIACLVRAVRSALAGCSIATATPIPALRYRLLAGSTIEYRPVSPERPHPQPVSGTLDFVRSDSGSPNTLFEYTLSGVELDGGAEFSVSTGTPTALGCAGERGFGCLSATTIYPGAYFVARLSINGEEAWLDGGALRDSESRPPRFQDHPLQLCGVAGTRSVNCDAIFDGLDAGYVLRLFAVPE